MLASTKYPNQQLVITGTHNVGAQDTILLCDTSSAPVVVNLDTFTANYWSTQYTLYVVDYSGNAAVNNITVNAPSGYTINTMSAYVISANNVAIKVSIAADTKYIADYSTVPGHIIADEGVNLTQQPILDFQGAGVTATNGSGRTIVTIPGGGIAGHVIANQGVNLAQQPILNFTGTGVVAANGSGQTTVTINGTAVTVANTVFVMKNGNDSTGLVERFDKPFLTIAAARAAAVAAFTPSAINRILIKVYSGNYAEQIILVNYIDYDLSDGVISQGSAGTLITDSGVAANSIVYGKANLTTSFTGAGTAYSINITHASSNVFVYINNITMNGTTGTLVGVQSTGNLYLYCNDIYCENTGSGLVICIQPSLSSIYAYVNNITGKNVNGVLLAVNSAGLGSKLYMKANNIHSEGGDSVNGVWSVAIQSDGYLDLLCNNITCAPTSTSSTRGWCVGQGAGGGVGYVVCNNIICSPTINNFATCINFGASGSLILSATATLTVDCKEAKMNAIAATNNVIRQENANAASRFYFKGRAVASGAFDVSVIKKNTGIMILDDATLIGTALTTNSITCPSANDVYVYSGRADKAVDVNTTQLVSSLLVDVNVI